MSQVDIHVLAGRLYARRGEAVALARVSITDRDWQPAPNECHRNIEALCARDHSYTAVQGWLVADRSVLGIVWFQFYAHSVVESTSGGRLDITPNPLERSYPFLRHETADGDFDQFEEIGSVVFQADT